MSIEKCMVCYEIVNEDETIFVDGVWYHNTCFKCSQCDEKLLENNNFSSNGLLYCKPHYEQNISNIKRLPRGLSLPKPNELQKASSRLSSMFFKTKSKQAVSKLPPLQKKEVSDRIIEKNDYALTTTNRTLPSASGQMDQAPIMSLSTQNPTLYNMLAKVLNQNEIEPQDFLRNMMEQLTRNHETMNAISQLGQQMDGNQDLANMLTTMNNGSNGDLEMSLMFQQMMPLFSEALNSPCSNTNLLEHKPPMKHDLHRRCFSDSVASINVLSMDCKTNIKEAAHKIEEEYPALEIFSSVVESAAFLHDNVCYDVYGLADLCSEEELAEEFMEMLKRDVCRRLGKRYERCVSVS